jgi:hypothetical protein
MDAKRKFRDAVRDCDDALKELVRTEDRGKREILEQIREAYRRLAKLFIRLMK